MQPKKTAKSWLLLGVIFIIILLVVALLMNKGVLDLSYGAETLVSAIFGFGGVLFLIVGIVKWIVEKFRKTQL